MAHRRIHVPTTDPLRFTGLEFFSLSFFSRFQICHIQPFDWALQNFMVISLPIVTLVLKKHFGISTYKLQATFI